MAFAACATDDESAARDQKLFRSLATPIADMVKPGPYAMYRPKIELVVRPHGRTMLVSRSTRGAEPDMRLSVDFGCD
jgi:hypothetical protein